VGYKSIVAGHDANNSLSEHKKTEIRNKALLYIVASLSHLMSNGDEISGEAMVAGVCQCNEWDRHHGIPMSMLLCISLEAKRAKVPRTAWLLTPSQVIVLTV
jgi:hypothetical protein